VELNELLRKFYAEVKSEKGQPLTPSTLTGIRAAIHRQLTSAPISRSMNIMQDSEFLSANKMFEAKTGEVTSVSQTLQNNFLSLAQPYPNCTQHIQIGTMNVYHGAGPSQPTDHS
ncbi:unnamed protein product, partial [Porites lobata]